MPLRASLAFALLALGAAHAATAADPPPPRKAATATKAAKPSARGPGTQTEDELYIGAKPRAARKAAAKPTARSRTGDEDLEDLEVQRISPKPTAK